MDLSYYYEKELPPLIYPSYAQSPCDYEINTMRDLFVSCSLHKLSSLGKDISVMGTVDSQDAQNENYRCFQFAIEMLTGSSELGQKIEFPGFSGSIILKEFFQQAESPQNGDIAVYKGAHFAYVLNKDWFLSKFGANPFIIKHKPFCIPKAYGNSFIILRLQEKYRNDKQLLVNDIKEKVKIT